MATDAIAVRVENLNRRVDNVEDELRTHRPAVLSRSIDELTKDVEALSAEVRGLRRAVVGFAITVAASAVGLALTVIVLGGR